METHPGDTNMNGLIGELGNTALVGHTGFVGSALRRQKSFAQCFNSGNIYAIREQQFECVVCAAAPGSMLEANTAPDRDRAKIQDLIGTLSSVKTDRFILVSSIAVLDDFAGGYDETTEHFQQELAYGRHRRELEAFVEAHFANSLIVRLPALFGHGLRKNFLFDLLNPVPSLLTMQRLETMQRSLDQGLADWVGNLYTLDPDIGMLKLDRASLNSGRMRVALEESITSLNLSATQFHHPATTYQYYSIDRLWDDIKIAARAGLTHIHLVTEPVVAADVHKRLTGQTMPETGARIHREDMQTAHADLWGATGPYLADSTSTLDRLGEFFAMERQMA